MRKIIERCPACDGNLSVTRLSCTRCDTEITGRFGTNAFDRLSPENLAFAETFVRLRGNVREMERELGVPYNAVRNRLDEVIQELGHQPGAPLPEGTAAEEDLATRRTEVLDRLDRGELDAAEAAEELKALRAEKH